MAVSFWRGIRSSAATSRFVPCPRSLPSPPTNTPFSFSLPPRRQGEGKGGNCTVAPFSFTFQVGSCDHIAAFLYNHFGTPPTGPRLCLTPRPGPSEVVLQATEPSSNQLAGVVRFHYGGDFEDQPVHVVDAFCVRPDYRKTGLASQLLAALHVETQARGLPYSVFLKEGRPLPITQAPLYSSSYVYRRRGLKDAATSFKSSIRSLSPRQASTLVRAFCALRPDTFVLWSEANPNQTWRLWKNGYEWMAVCFQDAFQEIDKERIGCAEEDECLLQQPRFSQAQAPGRIGCLVGLFESPVLRDRSAVLEALVDASPFPWIWTDRVFVGADAESWTADGSFHWYSYGWTTQLRPGSHYLLAV